MSDLLPLGVHFGIPDDVYRKDPGVSQSLLKLSRYSMNHVRCSNDGEADDSDSDAKKFGRAFHAMMLQPKEFERSFVTAPADYDGRTTDGKKWKKDHVGEDQELLKHDEGQRLDGMRKRLIGHSVFIKAYESSDFEVSMFSEVSTPHGVVRVKARPDIVPKEGRCLVDLKKTTIGKAHQDQWGNEAAKWGYHVQSPYYIDIFNALTNSERDLFIHFSVEDEPPFEIGCYYFDESDFKIGRDIYRNALLRYAECRATGVWPGYSEQPVKISLPPWAKTL